MGYFESAEPGAKAVPEEDVREYRVEVDTIGKPIEFIKYGH